MARETADPLFAPLSFSGLELGNRLAALPLYTGYAYPDGRVSPLLLERYWLLARSGPGLVICENAAVAADGRTSSHTIGAYDDAFLPGLTRLAHVITSAGAAAGLQLNHAGRYAATEAPLLPTPPDPSHLDFDVTALKAFMESFPFAERFRLTARMVRMAARWNKTMSAQERERVAHDFASAAARAVAAGFSAVELHGSTGYLLTAFLSANTNLGRGRYGGSFENRARFPLEVLAAVRAAVPPGFPVGFRLLLHEWVPEGIGIEEAMALARLLEAGGASYLSVAAGTYSSFFLPEVRKITKRPGHLAEDAARVRAAVSIPVVVSGKILSPSLARELLGSGVADMVGLARPLLADPAWVDKARSGEKVNPCLDCFSCLRDAVLDRGVACVRWSGRQRARVRLETAMLGRNPLHRMVAATSGDLDFLRAAWPARIPRHDAARMVFFFLRGAGAENEADGKALDEFYAWAKQLWTVCGLDAGGLARLDALLPGEPERAVLDAAKARGCGMILTRRDLAEPWRQTLAERIEGGTAALMGTHPKPRRVLVAVDFSEATPLLLRTVMHSLHAGPDHDIRFIHVREPGEGELHGQWREMLDIAGYDEDVPLDILGGGAGVPEAILAAARADGRGQIIMGRRGMSGLGGVARWLLGSVSGAVLAGLGDESLSVVG